MKTKTANRFKVNYYIENSGMKKGDIAKSIGVKGWSLSRRISGRVLWEYDELTKLAALLRFNVEDVID